MTSESLRVIPLLVSNVFPAYVNVSLYPRQLQKRIHNDDVKENANGWENRRDKEEEGGGKTREDGKIDWLVTKPGLW